MNQAFGSPLQCLPATPLDSNSDSDSLASTPDEGVSCAPFPGVPSPPTPNQHKEITRKYLLHRDAFLSSALSFALF